MFNKSEDTYQARGGAQQPGYRLKIDGRWGQWQRADNLDDAMQRAEKALAASAKSKKKKP